MAAPGPQQPFVEPEAAPASVPDLDANAMELPDLEEIRILLAAEAPNAFDGPDGLNEQLAVDSPLPSAEPAPAKISADGQRAFIDWLNRAVDKDREWAPAPDRNPDYQKVMLNDAAAYDYYNYLGFYVYNYETSADSNDVGPSDFGNLFPVYDGSNDWKEKDDADLVKPQAVGEEVDTAKDIQQFRNRFLESLRNLEDSESSSDQNQFDQ